MTYRPSFVAPPRWAIQPALTAAPELWRDAIAWPLFNGLSSVGLARNIATATGFSPEITPRCRAYYNGLDDSTSPIILGQMPTTYSHITELTLVVWATPDKSGGVDGGSASDTLASNTIANGGGLRLFSNQGGSNAARWRLPDSSGGNVDIANPPWQAGHFVQFVGRYGGGQQDFDIYDADAKTAAHNSTGSTGVLSFPQTNFYIGQRETGNAGSFPGSIFYVYLQFRRWTDAQIEQNRRDPFALFRPAPRVVVASSGTTLITMGSAMNSVSAVIGSMNMRPGLSGTASSTASMASSIDLQQALTGAMTQSSAFASSLDARPGLTGAMDSVSDLSSDMAMQIGFLSAMASTSALSGNLTLAAQALLLLSGTMALQSTFPNTLGLQLHLQGASDSASTMQSNLSMTQGMVAELAAESGLTGDLKVLIGMAGNLDSTMTFDGAVGLLTELVGTMDSDSSWNGDLTLAAYVLGALIAHGINIRAAFDAVFDLHPALNANITLQ